MRECRQTSSPGPFVGVSKPSAGPGTPNVVIAGSDNNGDLIASPVLTGDAGNNNLSMIGGNTNTGFRSTALGGNNSVKGSNNFVSGNSNIQGTGSANGIIGASNEIKDAQGQNLVGGNSNSVNASTCLVGGQSNIIDKVSGGSDGNLVSGSSNHVTDSALNAVSGNGHTLQNSTLFTQVSGNANKLNNVVNSQVSGYNNDVSPLSGTGADYNDVSGANNVVKGDYCRVSGGNNNVQALNASVDGTGHVVAGNNSATEGSSNTVGANATNAHAEGTGNTASGATSHVQGEGNTAKYAQDVKGRFAVVDAVANDTTPTAGQMVEIVGWGASNASRINIRTLDDSGNEFIAGNLSFDSAKGIEGVIDGTAKNAGIVGEYLSAETAIGGVSIPSSGVAQTILQLTLTPGIWRLDGWLSFFAAAATIPVGASYAIGWSLNTNTLPTSGFGLRRQTMFVTPPVLTVQAAKFGGCCVTYGNVNINANTTFYLCARGDFSAGTLAGFGYCEARRVG